MQQRGKTKTTGGSAGSERAASALWLAGCLGLMLVPALLASPLWAGQAPAVRHVASASTAPRNIRLVLQITIDQLRGDLWMRMRDRWGEGGFRRLMDGGAVFTNARHGHANTETVSGHATLATGADPSVHGMVGNRWFESSGAAPRYIIQDASVRLVGERESGGSSAVAPSEGRSPKAMLAPTLADSIAQAGGKRAKVFSVSLKDRGSVPMSGQAGRALWWSSESGRFVSSTFYYPSGRLPAWMETWNAQGHADRVGGRAWTLLGDRSSYAAADRDGMLWEQPPHGMGRVFPHRFDRRALDRDFYDAVAASPFGDELLLGFTRELIAREQLASDEVVDYLSVSFSSPDSIGHHFGPFSLETEDELLRLDVVVAALLDAVEKAAGGGRVLVVLSSDHGVAAPPGELEAAGKETGTLRLSELVSSEEAQATLARYGQDWIRGYAGPYVYLDRAKLRRRGKDPDRAASELAALIAQTPGVAAVFTRNAILKGHLPSTQAARAVARNYCVDRSGDLHVVQQPGWQIEYEGPGASAFATSHGTPWGYDAHVPLLLWGAGVAPATVSRPVETIDVAPTIAALLGVAPPARATGKVLAEVRRVDAAGSAPNPASPASSRHADDGKPASAPPTPPAPAP